MSIPSPHARCLRLLSLLVALGVSFPNAAHAQPDAHPAAPTSAEQPIARAPDSNAIGGRAPSEAAAAAARPTPIVPVVETHRGPAFQLYAELDLPLLGIGLVFGSARLLRGQSAYCAPLCDPGDLNALDRKTAGYWSPGWQLTSDLALSAIAVSAAVWMVADEGILYALNDGVVIAQSALAAMATASIMTLSANRPRPFLYGEDAPLRERNDPDAGLSFLSSHAAVAFATATSTFMATRRLHPNRKLPLVVAGFGGTLAALVAVSRVFGGKHFITDALGGAIIGTSMGVLVPALHGAPVSVVPSASRGRAGLALVGTL